MLRVGEQHPDEHGVEYDEEYVETVAPGTKGTIASASGRTTTAAIVVEKPCGKYVMPDQSCDVGESRRDTLPLVSESVDGVAVCCISPSDEDHGVVL